MALVFHDTAASTAAGERLSVSGSTSTSTGRAPTCSITLTEAGCGGRGPAGGAGRRACGGGGLGGGARGAGGGGEGGGGGGGGSPGSRRVLLRLGRHRDKWLHAVTFPGCVLGHEERDRSDE